MKMNKIAIALLGIAAVSLTSCGRKLSPKPEKGAEIIYPGTYPKPESDYDCECE